MANPYLGMKTRAEIEHQIDVFEKTNAILNDERLQHYIAGLKWTLGETLTMADELSV